MQRVRRISPVGCRLNEDWIIFLASKITDVVTRKRGNCECIATWGSPTPRIPIRFNSSPVPSLNSPSLSAAVLERFYCLYVTLRCDLDLQSTLVARHNFLTSCNTTNTRGLCAHPVLISFQSPSRFNIRISCFSVFRCESLEFITCQYLWIPVTSYFQTSSKDILFPVSLPRFSCPSYLEYLRPRALVLLRSGAICHLLTYLLTYLLTTFSRKSAWLCP